MKEVNQHTLRTSLVVQYKIYPFLRLVAYKVGFLTFLVAQGSQIIVHISHSQFYHLERKFMSYISDEGLWGRLCRGVRVAKTVEPWRLTRWFFDTLDKLLTFLQKWNILLCFPYSEFAGYFWKVMTCHGVYKVFTGSRVSDIKWKGWV